MNPEFKELMDRYVAAKNALRGLDEAHAEETTYNSVKNALDSGDDMQVVLLLRAAGYGVGRRVTATLSSKDGRRNDLGRVGQKLADSTLPMVVVLQNPELLEGIITWLRTGDIHPIVRSLNSFTAHQQMPREGVRRLKEVLDVAGIDFPDVTLADLDKMAIAIARAEMHKFVPPAA